MNVLINVFVGTLLFVFITKDKKQEQKEIKFDLMNVHVVSVMIFVQKCFITRKLHAFLTRFFMIK